MLAAFMDIHRVAKKSNLPDTFSAEVKQGYSQPCFTSHTIIKCVFRNMYNVMFFTVYWWLHQ